MCEIDLRSFQKKCFNSQNLVVLRYSPNWMLDLFHFWLKSKPGGSPPIVFGLFFGGVVDNYYFAHAIIAVTAATTLSPLFFTNGVKSENIPPCEIIPWYIVGAPASTPGQIPNYTPGVDYVGSQNLPPPPSQDLPPPPLLWLCEVYSAPRIYLSLPEYTPFSTNICDPPRIYSFLPEYTPLFNNYMRPSQNLPLRPRI